MSSIIETIKDKCLPCKNKNLIHENIRKIVELVMVS